MPKTNASTKKIIWTQKISLPDGTTTPGEWNQKFDEWDLSSIPLKNKRVLDIGCLDGQYSFYAEKAGAREVVSLDIIEPKKNKISYPQGEKTNQGYLYAHKALKSKVKYIFPYSIYDVTPEQFGMFDIVFFVGVIYHLAHPLFALERINRLLPKNGIMILESETNRYFTQFYHKNHLKHKLTTKRTTKQNPLHLLKTEIKTNLVNKLKTVLDVDDEREIYNHDASNFWVPTMPTLERFIDFSGFRIDKKIEDGVSNRVTYICTKVEAPNSVYATTSMYTTYKNRFSNFELRKGKNTIASKKGRK